MAHAALGSLLRYLRRLHDRSIEASDGELLRQHLSGNESAFDALLRRHAPMVWGVCRRLLDNEQDAEDAFQAVFLVLLRKQELLRVPQSLAAFLHGVASRIAQKARATAQRRRCHESRAETPRPSDPFAVVQQRELRALLDEELDRLPEKYRAPLVLCYLEGLSYTEAARQLGWRDGTVCGRLARARELLRQRLSRRGLTLSSAALAAALTESASAPAATVAAVSRMAALFALGQGAGSGVVSTSVATLAQGALHAMTVAKLKTLAALVAVFCVLAGGGGLAAHRLWTAKESPPQRIETPTPAAKEAEWPGKVPLARTDRYGDPLPPGAMGRFGTVRLRHPDWVTGVAFAPDGKTIASSGWDWTIRLWDAASGVETACLCGHKNGVFGLTFSADGKTLVSAGNDGMIYVWDVAARKCRLSWEAHAESSVRTAAISPDGKLLASGGGGNHTLMLWDLATGKEARRLSGDRRTVQSVVFSPDGKSLAAASGFWPLPGPGSLRGDPGVVRLLDVASGKLCWEKEEKRGGATSIAFAPDGKTVASAGNESAIHIRDVASGNQVSKIQVPEGGISLESPAGRGIDKGGVLALAYSPDGKLLASASYDGTVRLWDPRTGRQAHIFRGHSSKASGVAFSPDGKTLASCGWDHTIRLWDLASGKERQPRQGHAGAVLVLAVSRDGKRLISSGLDQVLRMWDLKSGAEQYVFPGPGLVNSVALSPNGQIVAAAGDDAVIQLWDAATARPLRRLTQKPGIPTPRPGMSMSVAFSPDGKIFACGSTCRAEREGALVLYDTVSGRELRRIAASTQDYYIHVVFSADGKMLGSFSRGVRVWDSATGRQLYHGKGEGGFAFAPDGTTLVVQNDDKSIRLYDMPSGRELQRFADLQRFPTSTEGAWWVFALSPDGRTLARATKDHALECWELASWKRRRRFTGHQGEIIGSLFSADGRTLFSASRDTTVLMWDRTRTDEARKARLTANDLPALWRDLLGEDGERADRAIWLLAAAPEMSVMFLEKHVRPVAAVAPERLARLIADLDSDQFAMRDNAMRELEELGELAEVALRELRDGKPSLESGRRAQDLLAKLRGPLPPGEKLRHLHAVEVLEHIGTQPAQEVLQTLAGGAADARETREAKAALQRLISRKLLDR